MGAQGGISCAIEGTLLVRKGCLVNERKAMETGGPLSVRVVGRKKRAMCFCGA